MEDTLRLFMAAGFEPAQAVRATTTTYSYTLGFVTEEQGPKPVPDERARLMADFPLSAEVGEEIFANYEQHFEEGLRLVIAGVEATYLRGAGSCAPGSRRAAADAAAEPRA